MYANVNGGLKRTMNSLHWKKQKHLQRREIAHGINGNPVRILYDTRAWREAISMGH